MNIDPETLGWIGISCFLFLLAIRVPVSYVLAFVGIGGYWIVSGKEPAMQIAGMTPYSTIAHYTFSVVPLFLLMGYFSYYAGLASDLFKTTRNWLGHIHGGLPISTIAGGAAFGAASGSGLASTATLAKITIPEMIQNGVHRNLAYGVVASAGPLAQLIPPSILMIMYAIVAEASVAKLLIGGILPGILTASLYMLSVYLRVRIKPELAEKIPKVPLKERIISIKHTWGILLLAAIIIIGIYSGVFTPTEAGAIGAFSAFIIALCLKRLNKKILADSLIETIKTTSMVFLIVASSFIFGYFLSITRLPTNISEFLTNLSVDRTLIIIGIVIFYLILGMFIDMVAAMFLTLPIILPAVMALGYDPIWFGVLIVFLAEVALVTPPFGISLFIIKGVVDGSDLKDIIKGSLPFIIVDFIIIALLIAFPEIVLYLPSKMGQ